VGTADARAVLAVLDLVPDEGVLRDVSPVRIQGDALVKARPAGQALGLGAPALFGIIQRLTARLAQLEPRLEAGEEAAWSAYVETVGALALLLPQLAPERRGALLTTSEMAERLGVAPKTLLRHKARGLVRPTLQHGKFIRWRGTEAGA
jgi:hypothetical protein